MIIKSQDKTISVMPELVAIGHRKENFTIGDKLKEIMKEKNITIEDLIKSIGNSYRDNLIRINANQELANPKMIDKLVKYFEVADDYFKDKELDNVVMVQNGIVVGTYETNDRALEICTELQNIWEDDYVNDKKVIYVMPEK